MATMNSGQARPLEEGRARIEWSAFMKRNVTVAAILLVLAAASWAQAGQGKQAAQATDQAQEGRTAGNYVFHQSIEFGFRWSEVTENRSLYNTFVNLHEGPRVLEQSLSMRSRNHQGLLFDEFFASSFGWGGDPNNAARVRVRKDRWYTLSGSFRRDHHFFDYNLLANPLNRTTSNPAIIVNNSPHRFEVRRRMSDINLTLLPQSPVRVRLGYSRNRAEGPSFSSFHEGTDVLVFQDWNTTLNAFQIGVDVKPFARTNISYDQFLQYYKGDTDYSLAPFAPFLVGGTSVELGLPWNTPAAQPCRPTGVATGPLIVGGVLQNPRCNGYFAYSRAHPMRTSYPTEQLSFQSRAFRKVDLSGRFSYTSNKTEVANLVENGNGLVTRTNERTFSFSGPARAKRIAVNADAGVTIHITDRLRLNDSFRFQNFRIPGLWDSRDVAQFPGRPAAGPATPGFLTAPPAVYNLVNCPPPLFDGPNCPQHIATGGGAVPDSASEVFNRFLGQDAKWNTVELEYEFTRRTGVRVGYRLGRRTIRHNVFPGAVIETYLPNNPRRGNCAVPNGVFDPATGICVFTGVAPDEPEFESTEVTEHSALFGIFARPSDSLRVSLDTEFMSADNSPTRISPRHLQRYKGRVAYKPRRWANVVASLNILEARNNVTSVNRREHYRTYGFNATLTPNDRWGFELGYDFNDIFSATNICFVDAIIPTNLVNANIQCAGAPIAGVSIYDNDTHFGFANIVLRPIRRLAFGLGYSIVSADGNTLILNPSQPPGTLDYTYHRPQASVGFDLTKELTLKAAYAYYSFREEQFLGLVQRRNFHASTPVVSLRYAF
jgi:hypothetical protein